MSDLFVELRVTNFEDFLQISHIVRISAYFTEKKFIKTKYIYIAHFLFFLLII